MTDQRKPGPQRSCIACRREGEKKSFLRFVPAPDGTITPDLDQKLPGRGAYTCQSAHCLREAIKRRQFSRAYKGAIALPPSEKLSELVVAMMEQRIGGYLSLANKAGMIITGGEAVERTLRSTKPPKLLVLAGDVSSAIGDKLRGVAERAAVPVLQVLSKGLMGQLSGKESDRSAVAILSSGFAQSLCREIERYRNYLEEESGR